MSHIQSVLIKNPSMILTSPNKLSPLYSSPNKRNLTLFNRYGQQFLGSARKQHFTNITPKHRVTPCTQAEYLPRPENLLRHGEAC